MSNRELDAEVALKVMQWTISPDKHERDWVDKDGNYMAASPESFTGLRPFEPSERIQDAFLVVEKMRERFSVSIWHCSNWNVLFTSGIQPDVKRFHSNCDQLPEAIVKAALAAISS